MHDIDTTQRMGNRMSKKPGKRRKNMRFSLTKSYNNKHEKLFDKNKTEAAATQSNRPAVVRS
jgi:hypothetical protein